VREHELVELLLDIVEDDRVERLLRSLRRCDAGIVDRARCGDAARELLEAPT
jgi:hypothetical protein